MTFPSPRGDHGLSPVRRTMAVGKYLLAGRQCNKPQEMLSLVEAFPAQYTVCCHEHFCATPATGFGAMCDFAGIPSPARTGWDVPAGFFRRCYRSGLPPQLKDGVLRCPPDDTPIHGKGGAYNPIPAVSLAWTLSDPIREWVSPVRMDLLKRVLGTPLVDFWMNDDQRDYSRLVTQEWIDLVQSSLLSRREDP